MGINLKKSAPAKPATAPAPVEEEPVEEETEGTESYEGSEETIVCGDDEYLLEDVLDLDLEQVEEYRGPTRMPGGLYDWEIKESEFKTLSRENPETNEQETVGVIQLKLECIDCLKVTEKVANTDPASYVGEQHFETIWLSNLEKGLGTLRALLTDSGFENPTGKVRQLIVEQEIVSHRFRAPIKTARSKKDKDKVFSNLDYEHVKSID